MQPTRENLEANTSLAQEISGSTALRPLMDPEIYRKSRAAHLLRTPESMKWFVRQHGSALIKEGALLKIANHWTVHADRFDASILRIGQEMAQKRGAAAT